MDLKNLITPGLLTFRGNRAKSNEEEEAIGKGLEGGFEPPRGILLNLRQRRGVNGGAADVNGEFVEELLGPGDDPESQARTHDFAEGVEPQDPTVRVQGEEGARILLEEMEEVVGVVLQYEEVVLLGELVNLLLALVRVHRSNWIRASRVHVQELHYFQALGDGRLCFVLSRGRRAAILHGFFNGRAAVL
jgi:hypothetical protein